MQLKLYILAFHPLLSFSMCPYIKEGATNDDEKTYVPSKLQANYGSVVANYTNVREDLTNILTNSKSFWPAGKMKYY
jgi:hypothetical protein